MDEKMLSMTINYKPKGCREAKRPKTNFQEEFY
jgi:hypothetical protein